jgi:hypothetical protein
MTSIVQKFLSMEFIPKGIGMLDNGYLESVYPIAFYTVQYKDRILPQIVKTFSYEENLIWTELDMWGVKNPIVKTFEQWIAEVE